MPSLEKWLVDNQATVADGMNRGREPALIGEHQAALLRNVSTRGGKAHSRPRFVRRMNLPTGKIQGAFVFDSTGSLLVSVAGRIHEVDPNGWTSVERTSDADRNNSQAPRHFYEKTVSSVVIQDGQSKPIIYDGANFRRAKYDEVPTGSAMAYGNGRLAVAINGGSDVRVGDIRKPQHQSEMKFTEWSSLSGGGDFSFSSKVNSLTYLPVIDTGSGHGPLVVGCKGSVSTLRTQITQRSLWGEVGLGTVLLPNRGITGSSSVVAVNQDLYFRSSDGLRSLRTSTADYGAPGLSPLSVEVRNRFDYDTPFLLEDAQVVLFDNRLLVTHTPLVYSNRSMAQGLISFNFDSLSTRGAKSPPIFDGEWDEMLIAEIAVGEINGVERCFIVGRDAVGQNALWELLPESARLEADSVTSVLETRTLFADAPGTMKHLRRADMSFSKIVGDLSARIYFRPNNYPYWILWDTIASTVSGTQGGWAQIRNQSRSFIQTTQPMDDIDPQTNRPFSTSDGFQVRVEWDGVAQLDHLQVWQERLDITPFADDLPESVPLLTEPPSSAVDPSFWYSHAISPLAGIE